MYIKPLVYAYSMVITNFLDMVNIDPRIEIQRDPDFIGALTKDQLLTLVDFKFNMCSCNRVRLSDNSDDICVLCQAEFDDMINPLS